MGTSGENINDMTLYSTYERMDLLENTLTWRNIAPTAPDTLAVCYVCLFLSPLVALNPYTPSPDPFFLQCYPFKRKDPFIINESPHLYFAGNQPEFGTRLVEGKDGQQIRLVLVPSFASTSTAVLVNLNYMSAKPLCFQGVTA